MQAPAAPSLHPSLKRITVFDQRAKPSMCSAKDLTVGNLEARLKASNGFDWPGLAGRLTSGSNMYLRSNFLSDYGIVDGFVLHAVKAGLETTQLAVTLLLSTT
jgi:hypothetical protein